MATSSTQVVVSRRTTSVPALPLVIGLVGIGSGLILAISIVQHLLTLGADAPYVTHLMALNAPVSSEVGQVFGPAASSVDNLSFVVALVGTAVAAILLMVASGFWLTSARTKHPEATRRVSAVGFWMGLGLAIGALLPIEGTWKDVGLAGAGDDWAGSAVQLAVLCVLGLLLLQVAAPYWRASLRPPSHR